MSGSDISGDFAFHGVVVVLGSLSLADDARIHGGALVRGGANGRGRSTVQDRAKLLYSSCAVSRARAPLEAGAGTTRERNWFEVIGA